jgi:hypothetical protein
LRGSKAPCAGLMAMVSRALKRVEGKRTGRDLGASCSQLIDSLLDVADARRQVRAALEELHLLAEVVHGGGVADGRWL